MLNPAAQSDWRMEVLLVYIANCLYLISYSVRDLLRLRLLTLPAAICLTSYFLIRPEPLLTVVCWNMLFVAINTIQIVRMLRRATLERP
jgi:hypothetical protein